MRATRAASSVTRLIRKPALIGIASASAAAT
jgi:hypothetical protein